MEAYELLEQKFGEWAGVENTVGCASGTAALQLAVTALGLPKGSLILIPDFCMIAVPRAVTMAGMRVVTVDIDAITLNIDHENLPEYPNCYNAATKGVDAIIVVHTYGRAVNTLVHDWANLHGIPVIEDLAEAHGVKPDPRSFAYCWSFYKNKIIHGEEGGMVAFREAEPAKRARSLRSLGFTEAHDFWHIPRGFNARLSNAHANLILGSVDRADYNLARRAEVADMYDELVPKHWRRTKRDVNWVYDLQIPPSIFYRGLAKEIVRDFNEIGIGARQAFKSTVGQEEYRNGSMRPQSDYAADSVFYLPITPSLSPEEVRRTVNYLRPLFDQSDSTHRTHEDRF